MRVERNHQIMDITLIRPAAYGTDPVWQVELPYWPSVPPIEFRASDDGGDSLHIAAERAYLIWLQRNDAGVGDNA